MLTPYLDPKNDVAFKKIFGTEKNKEILIHFLNDVITFRENRPIVSVEFLKTEQDPTTAASKTSMVDILCKDEQGSFYIVEMQVAQEKGFEKRAQYYAAKAYIAQARKGGKYQDLKEVIFLAIADFIMFPAKESYKSDHIILDKESFEHDLKDFSFTFIELPKLDKSISQLSSMLDKWCYFFKHTLHSSEEEIAQLTDDSDILGKACKELKYFGWSESEVLAYDQAEKYRLGYLASMEHKFDQGVNKGRAEGKAEGLAEGRAEGLAEGQIKGMRDIIFRLLQNQHTPENIANLTGLDIKQIHTIVGEGMQMPQKFAMPIPKQTQTQEK